MQHFTEKLFENYLKHNKIDYQKYFKIGNRDVDFLVKIKGRNILCELKSTDEKLKSSNIGENIKKRIQEDLYEEWGSGLHLIPI